MTYQFLTAAYGFAAVILAWIIVHWADRAWTYLDPAPEDPAPEDNFTLELPRNGSWLLNYTNSITLLEEAIATSKRQMLALKAKPAPVLNELEKAALACVRVHPKVRQVLPLAFLSAVLVWFVLALVSFAALVGMFLRSPGKLVDLTPTTTYLVPNLPPAAWAGAWAVTSAAGVLILVYGLIRLLAGAHFGRLAQYHAWLYGENVLIPQLETRSAWLQDDLRWHQDMLAADLAVQTLYFGRLAPSA